MRCCIIPVIAAVLCVNPVFADEKDKPIGPQEAAGKVNETVTLQMEVKSAALRDGTAFLNSEQNFRDEKNFTIFIGRDALPKFKEAKIDDPAAHFKGKTVVVKGKVTLFREKPQIALTAPDQIKILETKEKGKSTDK